MFVFTLVFLFRHICIWRQHFCVQSRKKWKTHSFSLSNKLKNLDQQSPKNKLTVINGVLGSTLPFRIGGWRFLVASFDCQTWLYKKFFFCPSHVMLSINNSQHLFILFLEYLLLLLLHSISDGQFKMLHEDKQTVSSSKSRKSIVCHGSWMEGWEHVRTRRVWW